MNSGVEGLIHKILSRSSPKPSSAAPNQSTTREQPPPQKKIHQITVLPAFQAVQVQPKILNFKSHPCWEYKFHAKLKYRKRGGKRFAGMVWSRKEDKETKEKKIFFWLHRAACGIKPAPPALGAWNLNHWMRQVPKAKFSFYSLFGSLHSQVPST